MTPTDKQIAAILDGIEAEPLSQAEAEKIADRAIRAAPSLTREKIEAAVEKLLGPGGYVMHSKNGYDKPTERAAVVDLLCRELGVPNG